MECRLLAAATILAIEAAWSQVAPVERGEEREERPRMQVEQGSVDIDPGLYDGPSKVAHDSN